MGNPLGDHLTDGLGRIFNEGLVQQNKLFIEFVQPALDDLVDDLVRFARVLGIVLRLGPRDFALFIQRFRGYLFARNMPRLSGRDVHRDVFDQLLKLWTAGGEISFTVYFDQHTHLAAHVNIGSNHALGSHAAFLLFGGRQAALAQDFNCSLFIAFGFGDGFLTVHHSGACLFAQRFDRGCVYFCHDSLLSLTSGTDFSLCFSCKRHRLKVYATS